MNNLGGPEFVFLVLLALLVFGPRRLPRISRQLGAFVGELRRAWRQAQEAIEREAEFDELRRTTREVEALRGEARRLARTWADRALEAEGPAPAGPPAQKGGETEGKGGPAA
ncbi:MAG: hypothetical protein D6718_08805 [Acidobacteria bacterium]|nr:MAG: hypothetical protein D6718_08805 [Acidobacteriota bacterium]